MEATAKEVFGTKLAEAIEAAETALAALQGLESEVPSPNWGDVGTIASVGEKLEQVVETCADYYNVLGR